jgi:putative redox protein
MITAKSQKRDYQVLFSDGRHTGTSDVTEDKGGSNSGFRPHDLLESALATCLNIWLKMYAHDHGISVSIIETTVSLDRSRADEVIFNYSLEISGSLTGAERRMLVDAAESCPVRKTLSKKLTILPVESP